MSFSLRICLPENHFENFSPVSANGLNDRKFFEKNWFQTFKILQSGTEKFIQIRFKKFFSFEDESWKKSSICFTLLSNKLPFEFAFDFRTLDSKLGQITWQGIALQKKPRKLGNIRGHIPCQIVVRYLSIWVYTSKIGFYNLQFGNCLNDEPCIGTPIRRSLPDSVVFT